ncbi:MAG: SAM hydrolase/SAM-dependent halogenase family protein, partial [Phycisphaeraceae bacterium]
IPPHDTLAAAFVLAQTAPYFPEGTLHVAVVDPGVGTERAILAARLGGQAFLLPDNGVLTFLAEALPLESMVIVRNLKYLPAAEPSMTFHGRDVFAPIAGAILNGEDIHDLGPQPDRYKMLDVKAPRKEGEALAGEVIYVDRFGNLITNISESLVNDTFHEIENLLVRCNGETIGNLQASYGHVQIGQPLALFNSMGLLEIAVNRQRACDVLGIGVGTEVWVEHRPRRRLSSHKVGHLKSKQD